MDSTLRRTWAEIDMDALAHNYETLRKRIGENVKFLGVVKADAYGHGSVQVSRLLQESGADYLAVSSIDEAVELRHNGITMPVLILGHTPKEEVSELIKNNITQAVTCRAKALEYSEEAVKCGGTLKIHIKVDTGMSRLGFPVAKESVEEILKIGRLVYTDCEGMFTHFSKADETDKTTTLEQIRAFLWMKEHLAAEGMEFTYYHCANSASIIDMPKLGMNLERAGISTYGLYPSDEVNKEAVPLRPAMELIAHVTYVKWIEKGTEVSYGGTFVAPKRMQIATIPTGYGDGYPRSLSNKGYVLIHGQKAPILGRVCMDQFMVDVTHIPDVKHGDEVTLIGRDGDEFISIETFGDMSGRFSYEFACDISKRVPRVYIKDGRE